ncbi:MAG TPA: iron-sulfur cluster assembly scaffold protein [Rhizomicrobium sp.]|nr:iron-sulfur cluster assembly scaffold protein [Rhizomicrobium sp.]
MSEDLLYRRDLLRLAADASHTGHLPGAHGAGSAHNPACGDRVTVEVALEHGRITALVHETRACVLTQASATLLARLGPGRDRRGLEDLANGVQAMLAGGPPPDAGYAAFDGVTALPGRHVCVMLPLRAALAALEQAGPG